MWILWLVAVGVLAALVSAWLWTYHRQASTLAALDALTWLREVRRAVLMWASVHLTVTWDPLGTSALPIALRGVAPYNAVIVSKAGNTERARRIVAWFYRWHPEPTEGDWRACLSRFRLATVPDFTLKVQQPRPEPTESILVQDITLGDRSASPPVRGMRTLCQVITLDASTPSTITGPILPGGLGLEQFVKDSLLRPLAAA